MDRCSRKTKYMFAAALLVLALLLSACTRGETVSPDLQEGISYLESLERRDPAEVMSEQAVRTSERETEPPTEPPTAGPTDAPETLPPETPPPETAPPATAGPSEEELTLERWRQEAESNQVRMLSSPGSPAASQTRSSSATPLPRRSSRTASCPKASFSTSAASFSARSGRPSTAPSTPIRQMWSF